MHGPRLRRWHPALVAALVLRRREPTGNRKLSWCRWSRMGSTPRSTDGRCGGSPDGDFGRWNVFPSINVLATREVQPGIVEEVGSLWHDVVTITDVPDGERWMTEAP